MSAKKNIEPYKWKKGQSGNPSGPRKGYKKLSTVLNKIINYEVRGKIKNKMEEVLDREMPGMTYQEAIAISLIHKAVAKGDAYTAEKLWDRIEGKAPQKVQISERLDDLSDEELEEEFNSIRKNKTYPADEGKKKA